MAKKSVPTLPARSVAQVALEATRDWKKPYFGAVPYLAAMLTIDHLAIPVPGPDSTVKWHLTSYGCDPTDEVVMRFLVNAASWRGEVAKRCKEELKQHLAWAKHVTSK